MTKRDIKLVLTILILTVCAVAYVLAAQPATGNLDVGGNGLVRGSLTVNGQVGIGTQAPAQKLSVAGMIESMNGGFKYPDGSVQTTALAGGAAGAVPIGTVVAYAGPTSSTPSGWLVCDGRQVSRSEFASLFVAIGTSWGEGDGATTFNLPDLSGRFLRGVDRDSNDMATEPPRDPDRDSRVATNGGGQTGNAVGSLQDDAFGSHSHQGLYGASNIITHVPGSYLPGVHFAYGPVSTFDVAPTTATSGSTETRPRNAAVLWIVRAN